MAVLVLLGDNFVGAVREGNPTYVTAWYRSVAAIIVTSPFLCAALAYCISRKIGFDSHIPAISIGFFVGFLASILTVVFMGFVL